MSRPIPTAEDLCEALLRLRGEPGRLTVHKFARHPLIVALYGDDLLDGYLAFRYELERLTRTSSKYEAAGAWSIVAPADSVLDRLSLTGERFREDEPIDQRTVRRWSDRGMLSLANDLIAFAGIRGSYGQDLIGLTVAGTVARLLLRVAQVRTADLPDKAPFVTITTPVRTGDIHGDQNVRKVDLDHVRPDLDDRDAKTITRAWDFSIAGDPVRQTKVEIMAHRLPTPVLFIRDETGSATCVEFTVHRGMAEILATAAQGSQ